MWENRDTAIYRKFVFTNFSTAFTFMMKVALLVEKAGHHPKWANLYSTVEIWLNTHDAGNTVTKKDHDLAKKINELYMLRLP